MSTASGYTFYAGMSRVIDGDTVVLDIDLGFRVQQEHAVRLAGLNAPELSTHEGVDAKAWVITWFATNGPYLTVTTTANPLDKYGRYLADVYANGSHLNADLITSGHAVVWDGKGPRP